MQNKKTIILLIGLLVGGTILPTKTNCGTYKTELKTLKKTKPYDIMFDRHANEFLRTIIRDAENCKEMSKFQRFIRNSFLMLDTVIVTPETMPILHGYVTSICKQRNIKKPTVLITKDKWFFNAAAQKLLTSSGAILIGQDLLNEVSDEELEAVIAHEIGHIYHNHINKIIATDIATLAASTAAAMYGIPKLASALDDYLDNKAPNYDSPGYKKYKKRQRRLAQFLQGSRIAIFPAGLLAATLLIGKRYEKQADRFACATIGNGDGLIKLFNRFKQKDRKKSEDFDTTSEFLYENRHRLAFDDYFGLNIKYYFAKLGHKIGSAERWFFENTPFGAHPSPNKRIKAVKEYFRTTKRK